MLLKGVRSYPEQWGNFEQIQISFINQLHSAITAKTERVTAKNPVISPNFLVWKFCGKAQFPHSFGRFAPNYAETESFHKISAPEY